MINCALFFLSDIHGQISQLEVTNKKPLFIKPASA